MDNTNSGPGRGDREGEREGRGEMDRAEVERLAAVRRLQQEEHDHMQEQYRRLIENTARSSQVCFGLVVVMEEVLSFIEVISFQCSVFFFTFVLVFFMTVDCPRVKYREEKCPQCTRLINNRERYRKMIDSGPLASYSGCFIFF